MLKIYLPMVISLCVVSTSASAHGTVFSPGPETVFKGGYEFHTDIHREKSGNEQEDEIGTEVAYGITADWLVGIGAHYSFLKEEGERNDGFGNLELSTKYRFWRNDMLAAQESLALLGDITLDTARDHPDPAPSEGATDAQIGLAYGYESLKWQRWASARYRYNGENDEAVDRGDQVFVDAAVGYRPKPPEYYAVDTMWLLELNSEFTQRDEQAGINFRNSGGTELFLSPGFFVTYRNAALKGGVQIPVYSDLNGQQDASDYRFNLVAEWHF